MAGTFFRMLVIYLCIGMILHLSGIVTVSQNTPTDPVGNFFDFDPLNVQVQQNNYTGLNNTFENDVNPDFEAKGSLFGFIDTLFAVVKFITYLLTGMIFTPMLLFTTYRLPDMFTYIFGGVMMFGLIIGFIAFVRSGLSP